MLIYKICTADEWGELSTCGIFTGSTDDLRDGFIHLSAAHQVGRTAAKFFAGRRDLILLSVDVEPIAANLRWEDSGSGVQYPHLYAPLPLDAIVATTRLDIGPDGRLILPAEVT